MDIAKQIFDLHGVDRRGKLVLRRTVRRERVLEFLPNASRARSAWKPAAEHITGIARFGVDPVS